MAEEDGRTIWNYVTLDKYVRPPEPASEVAATGLKALWNRLQGERQRPPDREKAQEELLSIPEEVLDALVPVPVWDRAAEALGSALQPWIEDG